MYHIIAAPTVEGIITVAHYGFSDRDFWNNGNDSWNIRLDRSVGDRSFGRWKRHMHTREFNWISFHLVSAQIGLNENFKRF